MNPAASRFWCVLTLVLALAGRTSPLSAGAPKVNVLPPSDGRIIWEPELRVPHAEKVFVSVHEAQRAWVGTAQGLMETLDDGVTWNLIPKTGRAELGRVNDVLFVPQSATTVFLASREKGIFRSNDGGKSWQSVGTPATGVKSLQVTRLACDPDDRRARIFYATHGDSAPGISKSVDGGNTWFTVAENFYVHELLLEKEELLIGAHPVFEEDIWGIYHSYDCGLTFAEIVRDVRPTVAAVNKVCTGVLWMGILKGRLMTRPPRGRYELSGEWQSVGPEGGAEWCSLFGTFGRRLDEDTMYAYDPHRYGLLVSRDGFKTWWSENNGLYVDRWVKEGANVCATVTSRTFYASINGQLYIGRPVAPDGPAIATVSVTPTVLTWTKDAKITFTARIVPMVEKDPKFSKIREVQVNLGPLRGPGNFALLDDGQHNDGAAGDNVFSGTFTLPADFQPFGNEQHRQHLPGQIMLNVLARDMRGRTTNDLVPITIFTKSESFTYWDGEGARWGCKMADGRRAAASGKYDDRNGIVLDIATEQRAGNRCLHVYAEHGPWATGWGSDSEGRNLSDIDYLSFWIKGAEQTTRDLKVMLSDAPGGEADACLSEGVWLIKGGYLKELRKDYQFVRIPMSKFLKKYDFRINHVGGIAFGGEHPHGHNFYIDDVAFEVEGSPVVPPPPPPPPPAKK